MSAGLQRVLSLRLARLAQCRAACASDLDDAIVYTSGVSGHSCDITNLLMETVTGLMAAVQLDRTDSFNTTG
jgi:acetate kinase